jgi:DNA polymerase-3 subunit delta'
MDILAAAQLVAGGQERVWALLTAMARGGRLPPTLLFTGPAGAGKELAAVRLAALLQCRGAAPCGECPACGKISSLEHADLHLVCATPSGDLDKVTEEVLERRREDFLAGGDSGGRTRSIGIDAVRRVTERVSRRPFEGPHSVVLVLEADLATTEAQNALLKLLEEPPSSTVIVLVTSRADRLLPTILSRCREMRFEALPLQIVAGFLEAFHSVEAGEARRLAASSDGDIRRAARLLDERFIEMRRDAVSLVRLTLEGQARHAPVAAERIARSWSREEAGELLDEMASILWGLLRADDGGEAGREAAGAVGAKAAEAAAGRDLPADMRRIAEAGASLERNADTELTFAQLLLDLVGKWY